MLCVCLSLLSNNFPDLKLGEKMLDSVTISGFMIQINEFSRVIGILMRVRHAADQKLAIVQNQNRIFFHFMALGHVDQIRAGQLRSS